MAFVELKCLFEVIQNRIKNDNKYDKVHCIVYYAFSRIWPTLMSLHIELRSVFP